jgi:23S rRNA (guanosine2251-2'-O)-methyltransferase
MHTRLFRTTRLKSFGLSLDGGQRSYQILWLCEPGFGEKGTMAHIYGVGPVLESLRARARRIERIVVADGVGHHRLREVLEAARKCGIPVRKEPRAGLDRLAGTTNHQGIIAIVSAAGYADADDLLSKANADTLFILLDGVEDPHNLGAIIRTAECAGATAVIIPERRAAHITEAVVKASAGATEYMRVARVTNLAHFIGELKEKGFWVVGVDQAARTAYRDYDYGGPLALVFGGEGQGLHRLVRDKCDVIVSVPMRGHIAALNVSVSVGIVLFEAVSKRASRTTLTEL